jgi:hypothetical protein
LKIRGCFLVAMGGTVAGLVDACQQCKNVCDPPVDAITYCLVGEGMCSVDAMAVPHCAPGSCGPFSLAAGASLTIPIGMMWPMLGSRNDLEIVCSCASLDSDSGATSMQDGAAPAGVSVLVDGAPFPGCSIERLGGILCPNLPRSSHLLQIRFATGADQLSMVMRDEECEAAHPVCPE